MGGEAEFMTELLDAKLPAHIPPPMIWDRDFDAFCSEGDDPFLAAARMHDGPPIVFGAKVFFGEPAWIIVSQELLQEAFLRPDIFSNRRMEPSRKEITGAGFRAIPEELDPPEHGKYRRILQPYFSPQSMRSLDGMVRETCDTLLENLAGNDGCEFIHDFASRLPNQVFLKMMGLPLDMLDQFLEWEGSLLRGQSTTERMEATKAVLEYLTRFIADQPESERTELMRTILNGEVDGAPISEIDILGICLLLYIGGLDTVYSSLGWIFRHLAQDQALQDRLRCNPEDIPKAIEEFERAYPVARPSRTVVQDCDFHGAPLRKGDRVVLPTYLAGRDPAAYEAPEVIDINRKTRNLTFGTGPHLCLGIHLAKREIRIVLESVLSRFRNIRIPEGESYEYHVGGVFGVDRLPLAWEKIQVQSQKPG